jgi:hypothetical protein
VVEKLQWRFGTDSRPDGTDTASDYSVVAQVLYAVPLARIDPGRLRLSVEDRRNQASDTVIIRGHESPDGVRREVGELNSW